MNMRYLHFTFAVFLASTPAFADDGEINNKSMSRNAHLTVEPADVLEEISHAEHAFIDMM